MSAPIGDDLYFNSSGILCLFDGFFLSNVLYCIIDVTSCGYTCVLRTSGKACSFLQITSLQLLGTACSEASSLNIMWPAGD